MKVLGIDSATLTIGVAIVDDERGILAEARHVATARTNSLLVTIDALCKQAAVTPLELDAIAIGAGPGSFTGLRIGMATAKGIAFAAGKPLWAVSSLAALAHDATIEHANQQTFPYLDGVLVAVLDARKGEVFAGCFERVGDSLRLLGEERVLAPDALIPWVGELAGDRLTSFAGDAIVSYPAVYAPVADRWLAVRTPSGSAIAQLALAGARVDVTTSGAPSYIRPSEAEVKYPDGVPGALKRR